MQPAAQMPRNKRLATLDLTSEMLWP